MANNEAPLTLVTTTHDKHIRRIGSDYTHAFMNMLPQGQAWPRAPDSTLAMTVDGLCQYWGYVDGRAADLIVFEDATRITNFELGDRLTLFHRDLDSSLVRVRGGDGCE